MTVRAYYRDDLALTQLETALRIFFEGIDFASVITLAGAADEIFGKLLGKDRGVRSCIATTKPNSTLKRSCAKSRAAGLALRWSLDAIRHTGVISAA